MKKLSFEIAKKINKSQGPEEVSLSSFSARAESGALTMMTRNNQSVKEQVAAYRELTGRPLGCRIRGKSIQVFSEPGPMTDENALSVLLDFTRSISFSNEDVLDVLEFSRLRPELPAGELTLESVDMDKSSASIKACAGLGDDADPEELYSQLMPVLERYSMGVIKERS